MVQVIAGEAVRLLVEELAARHLPLSRGRSKVLIDGDETLKRGLFRQLLPLELDEDETARNIGAGLQLGRRRRAEVVKGRFARGSKRDKARETAQKG